MQSSKRSRAFWARGFAALWAVLVAAAGGSALAAPAETVLYSFKGGGDGIGPNGGLIADSSGNLYGTTNGGGASGNGTVFKLSPGGTGTVLYSFKGGSDGSGPIGGPIADSSGNLYGVTGSGGASFNGGVVFKLTPGGAETVLHSFFGGEDGVSGDIPNGGLIADSSGNLYGTTVEGGAGICNRGFSGCGAVFKLSPGGTYTVLFSFNGGGDAVPTGGLIADSSGNLYGTAIGNPPFELPDCASSFICGEVFKVSPGGTETVLHGFAGGVDGFFGGNDGNGPSGLIADKSGNLYGTTAEGGDSLKCDNGLVGCGVVFKLSPDGTETVLYSFKGGSDGGDPYGVIVDSAGNLYGLKRGADTSGHGVVFKLSPGGTETALYTFTGGSDGDGPTGLIADRSGNLYGTTGAGGASGNGTVFKLAGTGFVPAVPFAAFGAKLAIALGKSPNPGAFELVSEFTLGQSSNGINPAAMTVTLQIGTFATTIPPGSFRGTGFGPFTFNGMIGGVGFGVRIEPIGTKRYAMKAEALNPNLAGTKNPVPVTLTIGSDSGTVSVKADIF